MILKLVEIHDVINCSKLLKALFGVKEWKRKQ